MDEKPYPINDILAERGKRYGIFSKHASLTQNLKKVMQDFEDGDAWARLNGDQQEALQMIQHKIGRILNGNPNYPDSWIDIAGYATLVANRLEGKEV
jgi:hypothetical protein